MLAALLAALPLPAGAAAPGPCPAGTASALEITASGLRDRRGNLRVAIYPPTPEDFLASGRYRHRHDWPVTAAGAMTVCIPVEPGRHAVSLLHDRDASGRFGAFTDGVGFANNPRIGLAAPSVEAATVEVRGITRVPVTLLYLQGLRPRPWQGR